MTTPTIKRRGWFRRNGWGLLLVLPLAAGLFAFNGDLIYERNYTLRPKEPVPVDGTGLATLDDYQLRVLELKPVENPIEVKDLLGFAGEPLPDTVRIWRLILTVSAAGPVEESTVSTCKLALEDAAGRRYSNDPSELPGGSFSSSACGADDDDQPVPYTSTSVFLLPADARPTSVIVTWDDRLPRYVRLPVLP